MKIAFVFLAEQNEKHFDGNKNEFGGWEKSGNENV